MRGTSVKMLGQVLSGSRYLILLAVIGTLMASVALLIYGTLVVIDIAIDTARAGTISSSIAKELSVEFLQMVDLFLVGTVLYIVAVGLYELFIDDTLKTPDWLSIENLDGLKEKLISVIVVLLGVTFLGSAVSGESGRDILYYGLAIAAVLTPLIVLQLFGGQAKAKTSARHGGKDSNG